METNEKAEALTRPEFKTYSKAPVWYWHKYQQVVQWNRIHSSEKDLYLYRHLFSVKSLMGKGKSFQQMVVEQIDTILEKINFDLCLILYVKINSK